MSYREGIDFKLEELEYQSYQGVDLSEHKSDDLNTMCRNTLKAGMHGICFSLYEDCLLYTSPSPRDGLLSRMPSSA